MPVSELDREARTRDLARVLLVDDDVTSRLTLQTVLQAGGYGVEVAASAAEAIDKLEVGRYDLVLSELEMESPEAGLKVLAHARLQDYKPATAIVKAFCDQGHGAESAGDLVVAAEGVPNFLAKVADLIGLRATRRVHRQLRQLAPQA
ncbi:MAG: response regulator [Bryobacteraceae bacterium]